jgi:hypothetical protein
MSKDVEGLYELLDSGKVEELLGSVKLFLASEDGGVGI